MTKQPAPRDSEKRPESPWVKEGSCERHWWDEKGSGIPYPWCDIELATRKMQDLYGETVNNLRRALEKRDARIKELDERLGANGA